MAPAKIQQAIGVMKDHTSIGLAMVGGSSTASDIEIAIIKATRHNQSPPQERHLRRIINLTAFSKPLVSTCIGKIGKRLNKTKNWVVALKTLMLVHRLLNSGDQTFQEEILFATRRGARFLSMSGFRDTSSKFNSWDFSAFVRTYAQYMDEQLEFRMEESARSKTGRYMHRADDEADGVHGAGASKEVLTRSTPVHEMKNGNVFGRVQRLKQLLDKFLACRPTGAAKSNKVVDAALDQVVKESFNILYSMMAVIATLVERFMQLEIRDMVRVHEIFCHVAKQYDELDAFYNWCKDVGIMSFSEFPSVEKIPKAKLDMMDDYIRQKSELLQNRNGPRVKMISIPEAKELEEEERIIEALPPVEVFKAGTKNKGADAGDIKQVANEKKKTQDIGDLLNVDDVSPSAPQQGHTMALALFDGASPATTATENTITSWVDFKDDSSEVTQWEPFKYSSDDWEAKLVQSDRNLTTQRTNLPGSFDPFMLDDMYQNGSLSYSGPVAYRRPEPVPSVGNGRASLLPSNANPFAGSLVNAPPAHNGGANCLPSNADPFIASPVIAPPAAHEKANSFSSKSDPFATSPATAPPADHGRTNSSPANIDTFITSTVIGPPVYRQISHIENKQRFLPNNQPYWHQHQQYAKDGIPRWIGIGNVHQQYPYKYVADGYMQAW